MRDPVVLPSSRTIVDRSTIKQHYLSDPTDPFNRQPLKWEDIVDATEMREQIQKFLAERKAKHVEASLAEHETAAASDEGGRGVAESCPQLHACLHTTGVRASSADGRRIDSVACIRSRERH